MNRLKKIRDNVHKIAKIFNLYRIKDGAILAGICKMIAEKFFLKVLIIRLLFVTISIGSLGLGALVYALLSWMLPKKEKIEKNYIDVEFKEKEPSKEIE